MNQLRKPDQNGTNWVVQLQQEMNNLFRRFFQEPLSPSPSFGESMLTNNFSFTPALNVRETEQEYIVEAEVPGMDVKELEIEISDRILTIRGEKKEEIKQEEEESYLMERKFGSFRRSFTLPENALVDKVSAYTKNGVLYITIPKEEPADIRKIEIDDQD